MEEEIKDMSSEDWLNEDEGTNQQRNDGKWCKIFREALGVKQVVIANDLNITQQGVAKAEKRTHLPNHVLEVYAKNLRIPADLIKKMPDIEKVTNIFYDHSQNIATQNINPLEALVKQFEKTQNVYESYISNQKERIEDQKGMMSSFEKTVSKQTDMLTKLADKMGL